MFDFVKKMLALLSRRERKQLYLLFAAMVVMAIIDVASIGSVMPFMAVVSNPDVIESNKWLNWLYTSFSFESSNSFLLVLGGIVLLILVLSNTCTAIITWMIFRYTWMRNHSLARSLLAKYLYEPYVFFLNRNTAELEKNILDEVQLVITGVITPVLMIVKSGVVIFFVFLLLIFMDPILAIIVSLTLGSAYCALFFVTGKMISRIGWERAEANKKRFRVVSEALNGIKVLRVLGREKFFYDKFSVHSYRVSSNFAKKSTIAQLPKYAFEVIAFGGVLLIVLYFLASNKDMEQIVPLISLYAFAGYRLMPSMQTVFSKAANIRYALPSLEILHNDLCREESVAQQNDDSSLIIDPQLQKKGIRLQNVRFSYPGQEKPVLNGLDLFIPAGTTVGLAGSTGSGKTTIIDIILGLLIPAEGDLLVDNEKIGTDNLSGWQKKIGYVPQDIYLTDESVMNNIAFAIKDSKVDKNAVILAAKIANVHDFVTGELPDSYDTIVGERGVRLSGGQKQRIGIARALYHDPDVLILDEATSALDGVTEDAIMQAIHDLSHKKTIIMIAHRLTTLQECDEIFVLDQGKIVDRGEFQQLMETCKYFQEVRDLEKQD